MGICINLSRYSDILMSTSQALLVGTSSSNLGIIVSIWEPSLLFVSAEMALLFPSQG